MSWPLSQDYNEALQNPQTSFSDPELRQGQALVNALGIPQPCSGNFADVYAVVCPATRSKWAVKCFTREAPDRRERYSEISSHLQQVCLPFTVDFQYLEQGIRIGSRWYPILKMHWVEGFALNIFIRDMLDKPAMLDALGQIWLRMARRLREAKIAHCDLQHGNVLLVPGSIASSLAVKLIDYDGMWVPALANVPSGEFGHPAYQHPQRLREGTYGPEVDRFSLLVIYCAIRALAAGGRQLWERFDTGDNLLFQQQDFEKPSRSLLFAELLRNNNPEVRDLATTLIEAVRMPLDQIPLLEGCVPNAAGARPSAVATVKSQATMMPEEMVEESGAGVAEGDSLTDEPVKGHSMLMGISIGAAVCFVACLGLTILFFMAPGGEPNTTDRMAKVKADPKFTGKINPSQSNIALKPETPRNLKPAEKEYEPAKPAEEGKSISNPKIPVVPKEKPRTKPDSTTDKGMVAPPKPDIKAGKGERKRIDEEPKKPKLHPENAIDRAIDRGVQALCKMQGADGKWPHQEIGATALAGLTLIVCGVKGDDVAVQRAADAVRRVCPSLTHTYSISLAILFFDRLGESDDIPLIESLTMRLLAGQVQVNGGWSYHCPAPNDAEVRRLQAGLGQRGKGVGRGNPLRPGKRTFKDLPKPIQEQWAQILLGRVGPRETNSDNSNTQFATLGLWVGRRYGLPVDDTLLRVEARFRAGQNVDGGWGYQIAASGPEGNSTASMTCAGLFGLAIGRAIHVKNLNTKTKKQNTRTRDINKDLAVRNGLLILSVVIGQPLSERPLLVEQPKAEQAKGRVYYFLCALERMAVAFNLDRIGKKDWYAWGIEYLLASQKADGSWQGDFGACGADTCFALLFLKRADLTSDLSGEVKDN
jgi:hypothetical protein